MINWNLVLVYMKIVVDESSKYPLTEVKRLISIYGKCNCG